jgi:nucleotide-binding universal stress UspA family protein
MKTVLLPTDFSRNAWNALFTVLKLYHRESCTFILLHAYQPEAGGMFDDVSSKQLWEVYEDLKVQAEAKMAEVTTYLRNEYHNEKHVFQSLCIQGDLLEVVKNRLQQEHVDLIVLGTQGATGAKRIFLGSNTVRIIKHITTVPLLAVPAQYDLQQLKTVLLPTDYNHAFSAGELQPVRDLVTQWRANLRVVYVANASSLKPAQEAHKSQLTELLTGLNFHYDPIPLKGKVSDALLSHADTLRVNLIVLLRHRHHLLETLTREPVVKEMAYQSRAALLVLPEFQ